ASSGRRSGCQAPRADRRVRDADARSASAPGDRVTRRILKPILRAGGSPMRRLVFAVLLAVLAPFVNVLDGASPSIESAEAQGSKAPTLVMTMENGGQVTIELWPDVAPNHVKNFVDLAKQGFYDGQRVHRVEPKFVVQFG